MVTLWIALSLAAGLPTDGFVIIHSGWKDGAEPLPNPTFHAEQKALEKVGGTFAEGLPRRVKSDTYRGLNPGFHIWVLGACKQEAQAKRAMRLVRAVHPGTYLRPIVLGDLAGTCPLPQKPPAEQACHRWHRKAKVLKSGEHWAYCANKDTRAVLAQADPHWIELPFVLPDEDDDEPSSDSLGEIGGSEAVHLLAKASRGIVCVEQHTTHVQFYLGSPVDQHDSVELLCYPRRSPPRESFVSWTLTEQRGYEDETACSETEAETIRDEADFDSEDPDPFGSQQIELTHTTWSLTDDSVRIRRTQSCEPPTICVYELHGDMLEPKRHCPL